MKTDYTIGIGCVFRIINQIMVGDVGGGSFLYRCLGFHDYRTVSEEGFGTICSVEDFSMFIN